jgi:c-di-GMP-binding flagellar brake protein YcgR
MSELNKDQKRKSVRLEVVLPVKYRRYTGNPVFSNNFNVGRTHDISIGGAKLSVSTPITPGTKLDMEIELSDDLRPYAVGKVIGGEDKIIEGISHRIEKVSFLEMDADSQDIMMKYIFDNFRKESRKVK